MFKLFKNKNRRTICRNGHTYCADRSLIGYITELEANIRILKDKNARLTAELDSVKPIIATEKLEPAISVKCRNCKYVALSNYNGQVIGCLKNSLCENYTSKD